MKNYYDFIEKNFIFGNSNLHYSHLFCAKEVTIYFQHVANNDELQKIENKYERFKHRNLGHFSCADETYLPANERNQEFIVIPIFQKTKVSEFWIYIEYFSNTFPDKPIEQRLQC